MAYVATIYFRCKWEDVYKIQERFGIPRCTTVNGTTCQPVTIKDEDWELLKETERRGYIQIRHPRKL
jgi:hypothetical protein